jgi:hypothetical protein
VVGGIEGARLKIDGADQHFRRLKTMVYGFLDSGTKPARIIEKNDAKDGRVWIAVDVVQPPTTFGVVFGDVMHNLRSALDLAHLEMMHGGSPPESSRHEGFRIRKSADEFRAECERLKLRPRTCGVDVLERAKPYKGGNEDLVKLCLGDDGDKHFGVSAAIVGAGRVVMRLMVDNPDAHLPDQPAKIPEIVNFISRPASMPLREGAPVVTILAADLPRVEVDVEPKLSLDVTFAQAGVFEGEGLPLIAAWRKHVVAFVDGIAAALA